MYHDTTSISNALNMTPIGVVELGDMGVNVGHGGGAGELHNFYGKKHTEESKALMSIAKKGKKLPASHVENNAKARIGLKNALGSKHSAEAREKAGAPHRGKPKSPEQIAKMSAARKAWWAAKKAGAM